ncbi:MAG TPA: BlaI/MecI/CopY family transcriptional regulator [Candidatus Acidoferrales bacterium]|nr:BlaI/MecI/CopY family transcriptional regulator [Candidatus Acidoferrales bacterium]
MSETRGDSLKEFAKKSSAPRRAVLDLAPLELDCMNILWPVGEATVRDIRDRLAERRPRAYTTIMTIMDRLARKGIVERRKVGRAYLYRPNLSAEDARSQALVQVIDNFFGGSKERLLGHLNAVAASPVPAPRAFAAAAAGGAGPMSASLAASSVASHTGTASADSEPAERIDDTLL